MGGRFIQPCELAVHGAAIEQLDTEFETDRAYVVARSETTFTVSVESLKAPVAKRFDIDLDDGSWAHAFVAIENGAVRGVIAVTLEEWNRRLTIRHLYVDRPHRRRGIARDLMEWAIAHGHRKGAVTAWVETSNLNHPGVEAYRCMGFELCGIDTSLYAGTPAETEFAVFLARMIGETVSKQSAT